MKLIFGVLAHEHALAGLASVPRTHEVAGGRVLETDALEVVHLRAAERVAAHQRAAVAAHKAIVLLCVRARVRVEIDKRREG